MKTEHYKWWGLGLVTLLTLLLLGFYLHTELAITGGELGVPLDDAWIHYQFARNISQGHGFSYNPGEPMPGSTAPLWTLLLAGVGLFTESFLIPSLLLSAIFLLITVWLTFGLTWSITQSSFAALLAALGVALTGRLLWAGLAGMETTAFAAVSLGAVWAYGRQGLRPWPTLLFALASQLRPEGHALFALAVATTVSQELKVNSDKLKVTAQSPTFDFSLFTPYLPLLRSLIWPLLIYGLVTLPYALFSLSVTGHPLPNTFYAKAGSQHFFSLRAFRETLALHWQDNPVAFLALPLGLLPVWRRNRLVVAWFVGLMLLTPIIVDLIWHHGRYTLPLIPFQIVIAVAGLHWLVQQLPVQRRIAAVALALIFVAGGLWRLPDWATMLGHNANEIIQVDVAIGHWLAENTPPEALIAVDDIGAIVFISQRRIVDLNGLVSAEMWPLIRGEVAGRPRNEASARLLSQIQPDYLAIFPVWHWEIATNPSVAEPLARFVATSKTIIGEQEAIIYQAHWPYLSQAPPQFEQDAILGDAIQFVGYDLALPDSKDEPLRMNLYWRSLTAVAEGYDVFIHVLNEDGQIVAQSDSEPVHMLAPTHRWQVGDNIRDPHEIWLPADFSAGLYRIQVGMFQRETGQRLHSVGDTVVDNALLLTTFEWP